MYPYLFNISLYDAIGFIGSYVIMFYNDLRLKNKKRQIGYRTMVVRARLAGKNGKISRYLVKTMPVLESESFTMAYVMFCIINFVFGDLIGTGANYFAVLSVVPINWVLLSINYGLNPLYQLDYMSMCLPLYLIFVKLSCFFAGCCTGIPWEYGLYFVTNEQRQVPVQLIEAFWGLLIFIILNQYRKKAKSGTVFPMYVILYCSTRFLSEFLRIEANVFFNLKVYHILCLLGFIWGIAIWLVVEVYREKINAYYDEKYEETDKIVSEIEEYNKMQKKKAQNR